MCKMRNSNISMPVDDWISTRGAEVFRIGAYHLIFVPRIYSFAIVI